MGINTTSPANLLEVEGVGAPLGVDRMDADGTLIGLRRSGSEKGSIDVSGETVSYVQFTGAHIGHLVNVSEPKMGMVLVVDRATLANGSNQPEYYVTSTTTPMDRRVIGVLGSVTPRAQNDQGYDADEYSVFTLGDAVILVTDTNGDIEIGDYLASSPRDGYAQKQGSGSMMDYTIAKAFTSVNWSSVPADNQLGFKWKLIPATLHAG